MPHGPETSCHGSGCRDQGGTVVKALELLPFAGYEIVVVAGGLPGPEMPLDVYVYLHQDGTERLDSPLRWSSPCENVLRMTQMDIFLHRGDRIARPSLDRSGLRNRRSAREWSRQGVGETRRQTLHRGP